MRKPVRIFRHRPERRVGTVTVQRDVPFGDACCGGTMDVHTPVGRDAPPGIVLAHSINGIREDLTQFAFALAERGMRVHNVSWRGRTEPLATARRNLAGALRTAHDLTTAGVPLVTWSDAGLVGAVMALDLPAHPDEAMAAFIGLGGYYGWPDKEPPSDLVDDRTRSLFGTDPGVDPLPWAAGNPHARTAGPSGVPFTLVVGDRDPLRRDAELFMAALTTTGHRATTVVVPDCGHRDLVIPRLPPGRSTVHAVVAAVRAARGAVE
jgi:pimeloyl-ACP methyl ester carboxylesterase